MATSTVDLVVEGGTVATESWVAPATVVVDGGRVVAVAQPDAPLGNLEARRRVDARGMLVLPGGVDPHCHVGLPLGAYTTRDSFESASLAALAGGTTTMVDFAIPQVGEHPLHALEERRRLAAGARCDYAFHGCFNQHADDIREVVHELAGRGVRTVKLFTTYRDLLMVDRPTIAAVMRALREVDGLTYVHAEANDLVERAQRRAAGEGTIGAGGHAGTRPEAAEERAVADVLETAEAEGAPVYFVHQSTPAAVDAVAAARRRGVPASSESCPHYLTLHSGRYRGEHPERWVCCPPLRDRSTVDALAQRLVMGFVDTVGSDHCCYDSVQKAERADDVREMPNGLPGVETRLPVVFTAFVAPGRIGLRRLVALTAANPARLNGLYPRKGTIAPGSDADLVILDPTETREVRAARLHMQTDYSPYEGLELRGWPTIVIAAGRVVLDHGDLLDPGPVGRHLPAAEIDPRQ
jgi:dihydropyrimidinase